MFGLAGWLSDRYAVLAQAYYDEDKRLERRKGIVSGLLSIVGNAGYYGAYATILLRARRGTHLTGTLILAGGFARSRT